MLSNAHRREEYNSFLCSSKEYDVEGFDVTEYLNRYKCFLLTTMHLGAFMKTDDDDDGEAMPSHAASADDAAARPARDMRGGPAASGTPGAADGDAARHRSVAVASARGCGAAPEEDDGSVYLDGINGVAAGGPTAPRAGGSRGAGGSRAGSECAPEGAGAGADEDRAKKLEEYRKRRGRRRPGWMRKMLPFFSP